MKFCCLFSNFWVSWPWQFCIISLICKTTVISLIKSWTSKFCVFKLFLRVFILTFIHAHWTYLGKVSISTQLIDYLSNSSNTSRLLQEAFDLFEKTSENTCLNGISCPMIWDTFDDSYIHIFVAQFLGIQNGEVFTQLFM